ncbi:hypothetical protein [Streptomyces sp. FIT100]|uniref:hypothetical protein n=1 Tax=Streptomyces sp. FIT100 TaxID=2837956 RepID=UPI0021C9CD3A|nr:hypothetical protein [Streptomyces sp. FIT100]
MRMRKALSLPVTAAALASAVLSGPAAAPAASVPPVPPAPRATVGPAPTATVTAPTKTTPAAQQPVCGDVRVSGFPIATRITGGPAAFRAGAGPGEFTVELTNTTARPCRSVHPVVVLTGRDHAVTPARVRMEFFDAGGGTWRQVVVEQTDHGEAVGAFGSESRAGGDGFVVPGHATLAIPVRLAFPALDTLADSVVANAAVVQRRGLDGEWVGQSGDYRFRLLASEEQPYASRPPGEELAPTGTQPDIGLVAAVTALVAAGLLLLAGARRLRTGRH